MKKNEVTFLGELKSATKRKVYSSCIFSLQKKRESSQYLLRILSSEDVLQLGYFKNASVVDKRAFQASSLLV